MYYDDQTAIYNVWHIITTVASYVEVLTVENRWFNQFSQGTVLILRIYLVVVGGCHFSNYVTSGEVGPCPLVYVFKPSSLPWKAQLVV